MDGSEPIKYLVGRIRAALAEDPRTNTLDIQVTITANKVYLRGEATSQERRHAAEAVTRELIPPDMGLVDEIWIPSYDTPPETETLR